MTTNNIPYDMITEMEDYFNNNLNIDASIYFPDLMDNDNMTVYSDISEEEQPEPTIKTNLEWYNEYKKSSQINECNCRYCWCSQQTTQL